MKRRLGAIVCLVTTCACCLPLAARADGEGQQALDQAIELKLNAKTINDLKSVIDLCETALEKGLDEENTDFAQQLMTSALIQRATVISTQVLRPWPSDPDGLRRITGMRQLALADLEKAISVDAAQPGAHLLIAQLHALPGGDRQRASEAIEEAIKSSGDDTATMAKAHIVRAEMQDDVAKALEDYNKAIELAPNDPDVLSARAQFHIQNQRYEEALTDLDKAIEQRPNSGNLHEAQAVALGEMGKYPEAIEALDRAIERNPQQATAYLRRARVKLLQQDPRAALADLDKTLELEPGQVAALLSRATAYAQLDEKAKALVDLEALRPVAMQMTAIRRPWIQLMAAVGKVDDVLTQLEELRDQQMPPEVDLLVDLGTIYESKQRIDDAIAAYTEVIERDEEQWPVRVRRGDLYLRKGNRQGALADYEATLEHEPENSGLLNNVAWILATSPDDSLRDGKRSLELATEACRLSDYKQAHILSTLAAAHAENGNFDEAIRWTQKAIEVTPDELKDELDRELQSYQEKKPWREALPPDLSGSGTDEDAAATAPADDSASTDEKVDETVE